MNEEQLFGAAAKCQSLDEVMQLQRVVVGDDGCRAVVAYGMLLSARLAPAGDYYEDAVGVLNALGFAKAELDKVAYHTKPAVLVTAELLARAQEYVDQSTIPCTEWPRTSEVVAAVYDVAVQHAFAGPWKRLVFGSIGQVVGVEEFNG